MVHPEVVETEAGKKRYTKGHIHKMAVQRTLTKFVEWLWREWWKLEKLAKDEPQGHPSTDSGHSKSEAA